MQVLGNIGSTVEKKTTQAGKDYVRFRLAENFGKEEDRTTVWYDVMAFIDDLSADLLGKGMFVEVRGRLKAEAYNKKDGGLGVGLTIMAFDVKPAERKSRPAEE